MNEKHSFWKSLPGILTGLAAVIAAVASVIAVMNPGEDTEDGGTPPVDGFRVEDGGTPPVDGFSVIEVILRADPFDYSGPCPVTIEFTGRVSTIGGSGTVAYRFLRNDGASAPVQTLSFAGPSSSAVQSTWRLGAAGMRYTGWQVVDILEPQQLESDRASFSILCTRPAQIPSTQIDPGRP